MFLFFAEPLPSSDNCITYSSIFKQDQNDSLVIQKPSVPRPMPGNKDISIGSQNSFADADWSGSRQTNSTAPRGILKHLSTSGSTDPPFSRSDLQSPISLDSPTESCIDRKQVRFSSTLGQSRVEWQDGKELGEHSMLDTDTIILSERENNLLNTGSTTTGTCSPLFSQAEKDLQEGELKNETLLREQDAGQHQAFGGKTFI